jgi:hypothetical protein
MSALGQKQTLAHVRVMSAILSKADIRVRNRHVRFVPKADMESFDDLVGDLVAPYRIDAGIPSNRDAKSENEGRCRAERHGRDMQRQQCHTKSGKAGNGARQYGGGRGTTDAAMQDEHDTRINHWEYREYAASRRANAEA